MTKRKELERKLEEELDSLSKKIDALEARMKKEQTRASELERQAVEKLTAMRHSAKQKLQELKGASETHWEEFHKGIEHYWKSLGTEIKAYDERHL